LLNDRMNAIGRGEFAGLRSTCRRCSRRQSVLDRGRSRRPWWRRRRWWRRPWRPGWVRARRTRGARTESVSGIDDVHRERIRFRLDALTAA
jgi:hypothetical protein